MTATEELERLQRGAWPSPRITIPARGYIYPPVGHLTLERMKIAVEDFEEEPMLTARVHLYDNNYRKYSDSRNVRCPFYGDSARPRQ